MGGAAGLASGSSSPGPAPARGHGQATPWGLQSVDSKASDGTQSVLFGPHRLTLPVAMVHMRFGGLD